MSCPPAGATSALCLRVQHLVQQQLRMRQQVSWFQRQRQVDPTSWSPHSDHLTGMSAYKTKNFSAFICESRGEGPRVFANSPVHGTRSDVCSSPSHQTASCSHFVPFSSSVASRASKGRLSAARRNTVDDRSGLTSRTDNRDLLKAAKMSAGEESSITVHSNRTEKCVNPDGTGPVAYCMFSLQERFMLQKFEDNRADLLNNTH